ncbi:MAG: NAD+ synthase, partial [Odoribacter sp.]|nr:NAD+ synthase [Odoribacter sp.]
MRIAIPQLNYYTGDIQKNYQIMLQAIEKAKAQKAELIIFPELAICGPFPQDLLEKESFIDECRLAIDRLALKCDTINAIIGGPNLDVRNGIMYNSAYYIQNGEVVDGVHKTILSDYDIYNESRYFIAAENNVPIRYRNNNIRILFDEYESEYIERNDSFIIYIGTSVFTKESFKTRLQIFSSLSEKYAKNMLIVGQAGGSTSILFDGNSMVYNYKGTLTHKLKTFAEDFIIIDTNKLQTANYTIQETPEIELIHQALIAGIKDYFLKHNFTKAVLGLSGGIDSALVAALTAEAIGAENVLGILMPSGFSSSHSITDAEELAKNLQINYQTIPIENLYNQYIESLSPLFKDTTFGLAEENIQARTRGVLLMAISNKFGHILLNTSNKSEIGVGYGTLYGDLCGSLSVIGDVYKTEVYELAIYINRDKIIIPENIINKAPSAELRPEQTDQDTLPEYNILDKIVKLYIEET